MKIVLPDTGLTDIRLIRLERVARKYDERLRVGLNQADGNYCVFYKMDRGTFPPSDLYPILGLGLRLETLPTPDALHKMIFEADTLRQGYAILDKVNAHNKALKDAEEAKVKDSQAEVARAMEWGLRRMSNDIGKRRVQVNLNEKAKDRKPEFK